MAFDMFRARTILDIVHAAWCRGDVEGMLRHYDDDLVFWCNVGDGDGAPLTIAGQAAYREFLQGIADVVESVSVIEYFRLVDGVGRAQVAAYVKHKVTGLMLSGTYRQVITYRDGKILRLEDYHDAAKMAAFWRMIAGESRVNLPDLSGGGRAKSSLNTAE